MPAALSMRERQTIIEMREQGHSFQAIAEELKRDYETVRKIYHRYTQRGQLKAAYDQCRHSSLRKDEALYGRAVALKQAHPTWAAGLIWVEVADEFSAANAPMRCGCWMLKSNR